MWLIILLTAILSAIAGLAAGRWTKSRAGNASGGGAVPDAQVHENVARERARLQFVFEALPVGVSLIHHAKDGSVSSMINDAHLRICGVTRDEVRIPGIWQRITHPDDGKRQAELSRRMELGEINDFSMEKRYIRPAGDTVWVLFSIRRLNYDDGSYEFLSAVVDITERRRAADELEKMHRKLLEVSRQAGMAEVAKTVLHNVGNVLNSVNVSTALVMEGIRKSKTSDLGKVAALLRDQEWDLGAFFSTDERGRQLPTYLLHLSQHLLSEQVTTLRELESLRKNIDYINAIVAMQRTHHRVAGIQELVDVRELMDETLSSVAGELERGNIEVVRAFEPTPQVQMERSRVKEIVTNLVRNAAKACAESGNPEKRVTVSVGSGAGRVRISVQDNGVGISAEMLTRIFNHDFSNPSDRTQFGLHNGALAAKEMGGSLTAESNGVSRGATFTLELPAASVRLEERAPELKLLARAG